MHSHEDGLQRETISALLVLFLFLFDHVLSNVHPRRLRDSVITYQPLFTLSVVYVLNNCLDSPIEILLIFKKKHLSVSWNRDLTADVSPAE